jgi:transcriptional regulator with XRE-family HTH domain
MKKATTNPLILAIERLAKARGSSLTAVARKAGLNPRTLTAKKTATGGVHSKTLESVASVLGTTANDILEEADKLARGYIDPPRVPIPPTSNSSLIALSREDFAGLCRRLVSRMIAIGISDIQLAREAGIPAGAVEIFMAAAQEAEVDVPALRPDYIDAIATRLGTNRKWLITGEGDENLCEEPKELQELIRRLKQAGPETWQHVMAFLDAVKARAV